ncbi:MAG: hypothetical protein FDZ70_10945 [Actinobacteria bacterium]|nr:MAG: hypothetical protein FDZ70_10945 [Actinomycetota bacterium]
MPLDIGSICRPALGERMPGDDFTVVTRADAVLVAVADGLGHGEGAASAAHAITGLVRDEPDGPLDELMRKLGSAAARTRGAAVMLVRLDWHAHRLECCGVGNVHFQAVSHRSMHPVSAPGVVGHRVRKIVPYTFGLPSELLFAVATDGLSSRIHLEKHAEGTAQKIAEELLDHHGKVHDDATCVVVRYEAD